MKTTFVEQERIAPEIARLFGDYPNDFIVNEEEFLTVKSAIDSAVHFYFYLTERMTTPINPHAEETEEVVDDLVAYVEYFWRVRTSTEILLRKKRRKHFQWKSIASAEELKKKFLSSYRKLVDQSTPPIDRFYHLMVVSQLQLTFLAAIFL